MSVEKNGAESRAEGPSGFQPATLRPDPKPLRSWDIEKWTCYFRCQHEPSMSPALWLNHMDFHVRTLDQLDPQIYKIAADKWNEYQKYYTLALSNPARYPISHQRVLEICTKLSRFIDWTDYEYDDDSPSTSEGSVATFCTNTEEITSCSEEDVDLPDNLYTETDMENDTPAPERLIMEACCSASQCIQVVSNGAAEKATTVEMMVEQAETFENEVVFGLKQRRHSRFSSVSPVAAPRPPPKVASVLPPVPADEENPVLEPLLAQRLEVHAMLLRQYRLPEFAIPLPMSSTFPPLDLSNVPLPSSSAETSRSSSVQEKLPPAAEIQTSTAASPILDKVDQSTTPTHESINALVPPVDSFTVSEWDQSMHEPVNEELIPPVSVDQLVPLPKLISEIIRTVASPVLVEMADSTVSSPCELTQEISPDVVTPADREAVDATTTVGEVSKPTGLKENNSADVPATSATASPLRFVNSRDKAVSSPLEGTPKMTSADKKAKECWSCKPSPDSTQLLPGTAFYVSNDILQKLQEEFGPGRGRYAHRYGWELVHAVLGPERSRPAKTESKKRPLGVIRLLNQMVPGLRLFDVIFKHMREVFGRPPESNSLESFQLYCGTKWRAKKEESSPDQAVKRPRGRPSLRKPLNVNGSIPLRNRARKASAAGRKPAKQQSSSSESDSESEVQEEGVSEEEEVGVVEEEKIDNEDSEEEETAAFLRDVTQRNPAVSEADVRKMMQDDDLKKDVEMLGRVGQLFLMNHQNHETCFKVGDKFARIRQTNLAETVYMPISILQSNYSRQTKRGVPAFVCGLCGWDCEEEKKLQAHVARRHFLKSLSLEGRDKKLRSDETANNDSENRPGTSGDDNDSFSSLSQSSSSSNADTDADWSDDGMEGPVSSAEGK